jgi:hypothetical protein
MEGVIVQERMNARSFHGAKNGIFIAALCLSNTGALRIMLQHINFGDSSKHIVPY